MHSIVNARTIRNSQKFVQRSGNSKSPSFSNNVNYAALQRVLNNIHEEEPSEEAIFVSFCPLKKLS